MKVKIDNKEIECSAEEYKQLFMSEKRHYKKKEYHLPSTIREVIPNNSIVPKRKYKKHRYHHLWSKAELQVLKTNVDRYDKPKGARITAQALGLKPNQAYCQIFSKEYKAL